MAGLLTVDEYVCAESQKPFEWGVTDCASTVDRWIRHQVGFSPMAAFGRVYHDRDGASEWLSERYGLIVGMNRVMRASGFKKTKDPEPGDVGLVICGNKLCAAIKTRLIWFSHDETGLIGAPHSACWKAWSIASCRQ